MAKAIGPTFGAELSVAGVDITRPFSWNAAGTLNLGQLTAAEQAAIQAVYAAHDPATPDRRAVAGAAFAAGCRIVSTGTPALSGTYGITPQDEINIMGLQSAVEASQPWPGYLRDATSAKHTMTGPQLTAVADAILGYIAAIDAYVAGDTPSMPAQPVQIA
jgi:hypothetical protein